MLREPKSCLSYLGTPKQENGMRFLMWFLNSWWCYSPNCQGPKNLTGVLSTMPMAQDPVSVHLGLSAPASAMP